MDEKIETGIYRMDDGRYRVRAYIKDPRTGKKRERDRRVDASCSLSQLREIRAELRASMREEPPTDHEPARTTVAFYALEWMQGKRLKPSTQAVYMDALEHWILPPLGHYFLDAIVRPDVRRWVEWAESRRMDQDGELVPYATSTVRRPWRVLKQMLKDAHADGFLSSDPTLRLSPPTTTVQRRRERSTLSRSELGDLVDAARQYTQERYAEIATLAFTGMRPGELYALAWDDVDLSARRATIRHASWRQNVGTTKTNAVREVSLPVLVVQAIAEHRARLLREQHPGLSTGLVFPSDVATHRCPSTLTKPLGLCREAAGIEQRVSPQVLRRTFNTLLVEAGVDRIVARSMMGHSSEEMTERYSGVRLEAKEAAVGRVVRGEGEE